MSELSELNVRSQTGSYSIQFGGLDQSLKHDHSMSIWLVDSCILKLYPSLILLERCVQIEVDESKKNLLTVADCIEKVRELGANRHSHFLAIGGGFIQDLATITASIFMRGVAWTYIPTTLLGMVDSCVGGKSSINVGRYKNLAGNIYPPDEILIDPSFIKTLNDGQRIEGLCEAVKICFADDGDAFDRCLELLSVNSGLLERDKVSSLIDLTLRTKKKFVEKDEFDTGVRRLLNFGHTFGHAIEGATSFEIPHGVAVGYGMLGALYFSRLKGWLQTQNSRADKLGNLILDYVSQLPETHSHLLTMTVSDAIRNFDADKKHSEDDYGLIGVHQDGHLHFEKISKVNSVEELELTFMFLKNIQNEI